ncbi:MAG: pyridoxal-phosphate dependent enzyme, partial [Ardenticatenaceae bacterium]
MIELKDIYEAREVIKGTLHRTPVTRSTYLGDQVGAMLYFKLEMFQKTGSFKPRGVLNKLRSLTADERERGVIGVSAGNHAQALAW